jgi:AraC-like DNA-binding protein
MTKIINHVNQVINYIELNLQSTLKVEAVAASASYSRFHIVRLFHVMTGETITNYIRKRRLHEAARELLTTRKTILEIALDYQFQSHEAFSRSFKKAYRFTPRAYRKRGRYRHYFPRLTVRSPKSFLSTLPTRGILPARPLFIINHHNAHSLIQRKPDKVHLYFW